jgi:hypothetical protein
MTTVVEKSMGVTYIPVAPGPTYIIRWCETDVGTVKVDVKERRYAKAWVAVYSQGTTRSGRLSAFYGPTRQTATLKLINWLKYGANP